MEGAPGAAREAVARLIATIEPLPTRLYWLQEAEYQLGTG
jgi:hypothetical protein